jgi:hypothetical protein
MAGGGSIVDVDIIDVIIFSSNLKELPLRITSTWSFEVVDVIAPAAGVREAGKKR